MNRPRIQQQPKLSETPDDEMPQRCSGNDPGRRIPVVTVYNPSGREELVGQIEKLEEENKELSDRLLRTMAEFDNYRKRVAREIVLTF